MEQKVCDTEHIRKLLLFDTVNGSIKSGMIFNSLFLRFKRFQPTDDKSARTAGKVRHFLTDHRLYHTDRRTDFEELSEYDVRLNIQDFLKAKTDEGLSFAKIKELLAGAPYHITVTEKDSLALFKYSQLESDWNEPICRECRGLILEKGSWKIVRYAFDKFFNINESYAAEIDWASATGTEKIDGSLISLFYYKDKWRVATNGMIDAYDAALSSNEKYKTYGELWEAAMNSNYPDFMKDGIDDLDPNCTYTFELVSPYNKVVIYYDKPMVYHIGTRYNLNFEEMDIDIGIQKPKSYKLEGQDEYIRFVLEKMDSSHEGIVVRDRYFNRIKLKTEHYLELAHRISLVMKGSAVNTVSIFKVIKQNEQSEFLSYFPEMKKYFDSVEAGMKAAEHKIQEIDSFALTWKENNPSSSKKEYVSFVNDTITEKHFIPLYYSAFDGKLRYFISKLEVKKYIELFGITAER